MAYNPGDIFAGYTIMRLIGAGGMGEVYLARHPSLPRREALKVMPASVSADATFRQRFTREAELASSVVHPAIVTIYNSGEFDGRLWLAMEFIDGTDASELLREAKGGLDPATATTVASAVGGALDEAHVHGLLHRDVKPANILVQRSTGTSPIRVVLADFGIAKSRDETTNLTSTNMFVGTAAYVAPEQMLDGTVDGRADQYALAATIFELLTGRPPFTGDNTAQVIAQHLHAPRPSASALRKELPGAVDAVLSRGLSVDPAQRYGTCAEFADALRTAVVSPPAGPRLAPPRSTPTGGTMRPTPPIGPPPGRPSTPPTTQRPNSSFPNAAQPPQRPQPLGAFAPSNRSDPSQQRPAPQNLHGNSNPSAQHPGPQNAPYGTANYTNPGQSNTSFPSPSPYPNPAAAPGGQGPKSNTGIIIGAVAAVVVVALVALGVVLAVGGSSSDDTTLANTTSSTSTTSTSTSTSVTTDVTTQSRTGPIVSIDDVEIGDCVQFGREEDSAGAVNASQASCGDSELTFYAVDFIDPGDTCQAEQNSRLSFGDSNEVLCLTPNLTEGECYQVPYSGGSLADYFRVSSCSIRSTSPRAIVVEITQRSSGRPDCDTLETDWYFTQPQRIGYCLEAQ